MTRIRPTAPAPGSPDRVRAARRVLEERIAGRTLCGALAENAQVRGRRPALRYRADGRWRSVSWRGLRRMVAEAAFGLRGLGLGQGDALLVRSPPRPEALALDLAALHLRAVPVFVDPGASTRQLVWTARHCGARAVATFGPLPAGAAARLPDTIALDAPAAAADAPGLPLARLLRTGRAALDARPDALDRLAADVRPGDVATLCYGPEPEGSLRATVVTHRVALWACASIEQWACGAIGPGDRTVAHLPLGHSAGRLFGHHLALWSGLETYCCPATSMVLEALAGARPALFVAVPLIWDRVVAALERGGRLPPGLEGCRLPVSAGGPLPAGLARRLRDAGLGLLDMYGLTETFGPVTAHAPGHPRAGTVGLPMPGLEVVVDGGEVVVRTPARVPGYRRDPGATARTFGPAGTVRTADLGSLDGDGHLVLTGRKRELLVTAGGRNVAPRPLERALAEQPGLRRACVLGEGRPYVTALLAAPAPPAGDGAPAGDVHGAARAAVERVNCELARADRIRAFRVVTDDWSVAAGELRADGTCERAAIERRYASLVDELYGAGEDARAGASAPRDDGARSVR